MDKNLQAGDIFKKPLYFSVNMKYLSSPTIHIYILDVSHLVIVVKLSFLLHYIGTVRAANDDGPTSTSTCLLYADLHTPCKSLV